MKKLLVVLTALSLLLAAGGCKKKDEIRIGVTVPLSGALAANGKGVADGVRLRVQEINDAGGIGGKKLVVIVEDNKGDKTEARNSFKKLADIDDAAAVIGPITSSIALAVKLDAERLKVPLISPTATNDQVTANTQYVFRACFVDSFQGRIVANYAAGTLGVKKAAVMVDKSSDYSKGLSESFHKAFEAAGGQVVAEEGYQQKDTDFGAQLTKIKVAGAEIIFVPGYQPEVPLIIKQAKVVGFPGRLCGADGWDLPAVIDNAGDNIVDCFLVGAFSPEDQRPMVQKFVQDIQARTSGTPGTFEALGYDATMLVGEALKAVPADALGDTAKTRAALRTALRGLKGVEAVSGKITILPSGDAEKNAVVLKVVKVGDKYATRYVATVSP